MQEVCLVIPCFNEESRLRGAAVLEALATRQHLRLCFVNDGSTDGTSRLLAALQQQNPRQVHRLDLAVNSGKAEAVRRGVLHAPSLGRFAFLGYWDADLATPLAQVDDLLDVFATYPACQIAMGSRIRRLGSQIDRRLTRHLTGRVFATLASRILRLPVYDSQCGAKLFRTEVSSMLFAEPFVTKWLFDVELLARLRNAVGTEACLAAVYEVPLKIWIETGGSKLTSAHLLKVPFDLLRIHRRYNARPATSAAHP